MTLLRVLTLPLFVLGLIALAGCPSGSGKPRVAFVTNNPDPFWNIAEAGCRKAEAEAGVEVLFKKPSQGDPATQMEVIDNLKNQGIQAIAVSVIDPRGQRNYLKELVARTPLLAVDNDAPDSGRLCYVGTNNYLAGRAVGQLVKEAMPEGGVIAIFVGQTEPLNARQRRQGVLDELADQPPLTNINEFPDSPDKQTYGKYSLHGTFTDQPIGQQKATQNATDVLTDLAGEKNLCLIGLWAYNPPAILTAVRDKNKLGQVKIVGFDENPVTLKGITDGHIHATVVQDPFNFGYESVKMMAALAKGDRSVLPANGLHDVPYRIVTRDGGKGRITVDEFRQDLDAKMSKK